MSAFSDRMRKTANSLLIKYGQPISVSRITSSYNADTGSTEDDVEFEYDGVGYPSNYQHRDIDSSLIREDDTLLIFYSVEIPQVNDVFTLGNKAMTALNVQTITASGNNVVYKIQLRQ